MEASTLQHVIKQTPEICFTAVCNNYTAMSWIKDEGSFDPDIIKVCCIIDPKSIYYVRNLDLRNECKKIHDDLEKDVCNAREQATEAH